MNTMKQAGLYLHLPFCVRKCAYCDFASYTGREHLMADYARALEREMDRAAQEGVSIRTVYIGGGTPSLFPPEEMDRVLRRMEARFAILPDAEMSCEMNPGTVTEEFLSVLRDHRFNRISMGMQAAQNRLLSLLGRVHRREDVEKSVALIKRMGFCNFNLDVMLGLPTQTLEDVRETLEFALSLDPKHLSCYGLIVEENTPMHRMVESGRWTLPDVEEERAMYEICRSVLENRGLMQYEISNFAYPGYECRHNVDTWMRGEYIGIGCAAAGFMDGVRWQNPQGLESYLAGQPREEQVISREDAVFESVMLGLRMTKGVAEEDFIRMHGMTFHEAFGSKMEKPVREGLLTVQNGVMKLTRRGMDLQNSVLVDLM
ncbi:MAG: radical SAM family heme chaperone HemW [Clostridiales bacterium]|nr:radical SAM family heme chaperone HemW [Clostridiales bacterium]